MQNRKIGIRAPLTHGEHRADNDAGSFWRSQGLLSARRKWYGGCYGDNSPMRQTDAWLDAMLAVHDWA